MESLVFETIEKLELVKKLRLEEQGTILSGLLDDDVVLLIDHLVRALKEEYLHQ